MGVRQHERLRRAVDSLARQRPERAHRGDIEHRTSTAVDHLRHESRAQIDDGGHVDFEHVEFGVGIDALLRSHRGQAGVIDEDVDIEAESLHLIGQDRACLALGKIGRHNRRALTQLGGERSEAIGAPGDQYDVVSAAVEITGDLGADTRGCAGDEGCAVGTWVRQP